MSDVSHQRSHARFDPERKSKLPTLGVRERADPFRRARALEGLAQIQKRKQVPLNGIGPGIYEINIATCSLQQTRGHKRV